MDKDDDGVNANIKIGDTLCKNCAFHGEPRTTLVPENAVYCKKLKSHVPDNFKCMFDSTHDYGYIVWR